MNVKIKGIALVAGCLSVASGATAGEIRAAYEQPKTVNVATDTVQADPMLLGDGEVHKTGAGKWTIPEELIAPFASHKIYVHEGSLAFSSGATEPDEPVGYAIATNVIRKYAAMWVSTKDGERNLVFADGSATDVAAWRDVRETSASVTNHWFAKTLTLDKASVTVPAPRFVTYSDAQGLSHPALAFNGWGNGSTMEWTQNSGKKVDGSSTGASRNQSHFFAVHCVTNRISLLFGYTDWASGTSDGYFHPDNYSSKTAWSHYMFERATVSDVRAYRNGESIVPWTAYPLKNTFELFDLNLPFAQVACNAFFCDRNLAADQWSPARRGGDLLCEAIVFTNRLSETERVSVENYLMHKWQLGVTSKKRPAVVLASDSTLELSMPSDGSALDLANVSGRGKLGLAGSGSTVIDLRRGETPTEAAYAPSDGVTTHMRAPIVLDAKTGKTITSQCASTGNAKDDSPVLTVAAGGAANVFAKAGGEEARVSELPTGLSTLDVQAGRLLLTPFSSYDGVSPDVPAGEIPLDNPSFETPPSGAANEKLWGSNSFPATFGTWELRNDNPSKLPSAMWIRSEYDSQSDLRRCFLVGKSPDGACAMGIKMAVSMRQKVQLDYPGVYTVSFWFSGRWDADYSAAPWVFLVSEDGSVTNTFCKGVKRESRAQLAPVAFETTVATAGAYYLVFRNSTDGDGSMTLDDIHLSRRPSTGVATWRIPGGDFEGATFSDRTLYTKQNTHANWSFTHDASATSDTQPSVALATPFQTTPWLKAQAGSSENPLYPRGPLPRGGWTALVFLTNGTATTTFTPPKGNWRLKARVKPFWRGYSNLTLGASAYGASLGEIGPFTSSVLQDAVWPTAFAADGETCVTLELKMDLSADSTELRQIWLDDLELVADVSSVGTVEELVRDGGFENVADTSCSRSYSLDWLLFSGGKVIYPTSGEVAAFTYSSAPGAYGTTQYAGSRYQLLYPATYVLQTNDYPAAGFYRLTFAGSCRIDQTTTSDRLIEVSVANGAETNLFVQASCWYTNFVERSYDFYVPSAGKRELRFTARTKSMGTKPGSDWQNTIRLDGVSLKPVQAVTNAAAIPATATVQVADGAKLYLGFMGTNTVDKVRLGGVRQTGLITAESHPDYIEGPGALYVPQKGLFIIFR